MKKGILTLFLGKVPDRKQGREEYEMNETLQMREQDLLELYQLTAIYRRTYGKDTMQSLDVFLNMLEERYRHNTAGKDVKQQKNPRKAGRKAKYTEEQNRQISELFQNGASLRRAAKEAGCSVGHVQDILKRKKVLQNYRCMEIDLNT